MGLFNKKKANPEQEEFKTKQIPAADGSSLPISGGRRSVEDATYTLADLITVDGRDVQPEFFLELITTIEHLAKYNAEISYALDNVVQLANTPFSIFFNEGIPEKQTLKMKQEIERVIGSWYTGGIYNLKADLLTQVVLGGAGSAEAVALKDLSGIQKIVLINPKNIRFLYDTKKDEFIPYQLLRNNIFTAPDPKMMNRVYLNTTTYRYHAMRRMNSNPHGIPPFLSALESVVTEKNINDSFKNILSRFGAMGFLNVTLEKPDLKATPAAGTGTPDPNNLTQRYREEAKKKLADASTEVEKGIKKGYVVSFAGTTMEMVATTPSTEGLKDVVRINSEQKMSGLKQDPLMLGRNYSTTEAIGRVIMAKLSAQLVSYQHVVDDIIGYYLYLHLVLKGFKGLEYVRLESAKPMISDEGKDQLAYMTKIQNARMLYQDGVINQTQRANMVDFDQADQAIPRVIVPTNGTGGGGAAGAQPVNDGTAGTDVSDPSKAKASNAAESLGSKRPCFDYGIEHTHTHSLARNDADLEEFLSSYLNKILAGYDVATGVLAKKVMNALADMPASTPESMAEDVIFYNLYRYFKTEFTDKQAETISKNVTDIYNSFRKDTQTLGGLLIDGKVPEATFSATDFRTMAYYQSSDSFYLGKFITDPDTNNRISAFIKEYYIEKGMPTRGSATVFQDKFADVLKGESWKIDRIVATTTSSLRVAGALTFMSQVGVENFKVLGISDKLQCGYCASMDGRKFSVAKAVQKLDTVFSDDPQYVNEKAPFITSVYKKASDMEDLSDAEIEAAGTAAPPVHNFCRCTIVADI